MGPASMPSVPLMVGCGVSCTALLILLLIYAAFWRYTPDSTLTLQLCSGDLYHYSGFPTNALSALLCLPRTVPKLHRGLMRNKWFKYCRGWWLDSGNTHDRWQNQANDSAAPKKILFSPSIRHLYLSHKFVTLALSPLCRYIRSERSIILVNFCLSILASNLLILVGQSQTLSKVSCVHRETQRHFLSPRTVPGFPK